MCYAHLIAAAADHRIYNSTWAFLCNNCRWYNSNFQLKLSLLASLMNRLYYCFWPVLCVLSVATTWQVNRIHLTCKWIAPGRRRINGRRTVCEVAHRITYVVRRTYLYVTCWQCVKKSINMTAWLVSKPLVVIQKSYPQHCIFRIR